MREVKIKTLVLGMVKTNCYIVNASSSKEAVVIDPADDASKIYDYLKKNDLVCKRIILTHGHFDHITGASQLKELTGAYVYAHENEAKVLRDPEINASTHMGYEVSLEPDYFFTDMEEFEAAGLKWQVLYTPGHTEGGACYYLKDEGIVFCGDTLFYESIGRTDLPTGNYDRLIESINNKLMVMKDETEVYPGHGRPTTVGHERHFNPYL